VAGLNTIGLTDEVSDALADGRPVVALESTIISHGMPYPQNVAMATEVEGIVRAHGAVPATIAVLGGVPKAGLSRDDLELLASDPSVVKASVRDLPSIMARGGHGATTVAATMRLAREAGISVFVTGGLGGVHRGAATSFDISADLTELSRTPVCVVCAGVKSILDIGLTLEKLETLGVPVLVDGSDEFPSFYSRTSGFPAPLRADGPDEVARAMRAAWSGLGLESGLVVAHPIPEADELPAVEMDPVIEQALADLDAHGIAGRDATPYLLGRIVELTGGRSLTANIALVRENAQVGAAIAVRYAELAGRRD
jgi:pseudouridylate synthase